MKLCSIVLMTFFTYHSTVKKKPAGVMIKTSAVAKSSMLYRQYRMLLLLAGVQKES
jgi:hypothetical protein